MPVFLVSKENFREVVLFEMSLGLFAISDMDITGEGCCGLSDIQR